MSAFDFGRYRDGIISYVALGDSFTEGLNDPYPHATGGALPPDQFRGWADRVAEEMARHVAEVRYANLAIRGRLVRQIIVEQVPTAVELRPDLVTLCAGGNDLLRPGADPDHRAGIVEKGVARLVGAGAHVVIIASIDPGIQPMMRHLRGKAATYNQHLRSIAEEHGCTVVDLWGMKTLHDRRAWSWDRLHMSPEGHRRVALRVGEALGVPVEGDWREAWPPEEPVAWRAARQEDVRWARRFLVPWIGRRLTGRSSGDGRGPKRPTLEPLR